MRGKSRWSTLVKNYDTHESIVRSPLYIMFSFIKWCLLLILAFSYIHNSASGGMIFVIFFLSPLLKQDSPHLNFLFGHCCIHSLFRSYYKCFFSFIMTIKILENNGLYERICNRSMIGNIYFILPQWPVLL